MKKILITGSGGTIGQALVEKLLQADKKIALICLDNNESGLFFQEIKYKNNDRVRVILGDIRDIDQLNWAMDDVDVVYHTAAYKHVVMCERSPMEAVNTNILGVNNVIKASINAGVEKVMFTSSDKAVNPTNVMGTSKLMGERLITSANNLAGKSRTVFASTRFGNVLGSNGSVIEIFKEQIRNKKPVTVTHESMTRFVMSIDEAISLLIHSCDLARGGEVFVTKMPVIKIKDLAEVMIAELAPHYGYNKEDIPIEIIGPKPGEKMYEELMTVEESGRAVELDNYFVLLPAFRNLYKNITYDFPDQSNSSVNTPYISAEEKIEDKNSIKEILIKSGLLF